MENSAVKPETAPHGNMMANANASLSQTLRSVISQQTNCPIDLMSDLPDTYHHRQFLRKAFFEKQRRQANLIETEN